MAVRDAVERLDPEQRELVKLIHWEGFSVKEAATILGLNPSTARGWYASAKQELRTALCPAERAEIQGFETPCCIKNIRHIPPCRKAPTRLHNRRIARRVELQNA